MHQLFKLGNQIPESNFSYTCTQTKKGFPFGTMVKNPPANTEDIRDVGLIPGLGRFPGGGHGNPL